MKDIDTPVLISRVLGVLILKEVVNELVFLPYVDCIGNVSAFILEREATVNDCKTVYCITVAPR